MASAKKAVIDPDSKLGRALKAISTETQKGSLRGKAYEAVFNLMGAGDKVALPAPIRKRLDEAAVAQVEDIGDIDVQPIAVANELRAEPLPPPRPPPPPTFPSPRDQRAPPLPPPKPPPPPTFAPAPQRAEPLPPPKPPPPPTFTPAPQRAEPLPPPKPPPPPTFAPAPQRAEPLPPPKPPPPPLRPQRNDRPVESEEIYNQIQAMIEERVK